MIPTFPFLSLNAERRSKPVKPAAKKHGSDLTQEEIEAHESLPATHLQAQEVEQARLFLQDYLIHSQRYRAVLTTAIERHLQQGFSACELFLQTNGEMDASADDDNPAEMPIDDGADCVDAPMCCVVQHELTLETLVSLHFLPTFLLQVARQIVLQARANSTRDAALCLLQKAMQNLQNKRQQMIASHLGLVAFIARKYKTQLSFDDVMQEGIVGLIKAVDRFDYRRNIRFSTYAGYWIKQAISRLIIKQDKIVRLPVALAEKAPIVFELMRECYLQQQRWPSLQELKANCDLSEEELKTVSSYYQATHSLDATADESEEDEGLALMEKLVQAQFALPLDALVAQNLIQYLYKALDSLPEKEANILIMRFGLKNHPEMTLQAIADQQRVTRERVRQIQNAALNKLKQQFGFELMLFLEPNDH